MAFTMTLADVEASIACKVRSIIAAGPPGADAGWLAAVLARHPAAGPVADCLCGRIAQLRGLLDARQVLQLTQAPAPTEDAGYADPVLDG